MTIRNLGVVLVVGASLSVAAATAAAQSGQRVALTIHTYPELTKFVSTVLPQIAQEGSDPAVFRFTDGQSLVTQTTGGAKCRQSDEKGVIADYQGFVRKVLARGGRAGLEPDALANLARGANEQLATLLAGVAGDQSSATERRSTSFRICSCSANGRPGMLNATSYASAMYQFTIETLSSEDRVKK